MLSRTFRFLCASIFFARLLPAETPPKEPRDFLPPPFDQFFAKRVAELSGDEWQNEITRENWPEKQKQMRAQLQRMLGLDPWPVRGDLKPVVTGTVRGDGYFVEKLYFQSSPGLYVTADFYRPEKIDAPLPTILYVCGHSLVVENGVSMGNKTGYQHHGVWFARHGYACLVIDTIQLGEIRGEHHGTYKFGRWWWASRGYTPAGVEAWNGLRALDYLETRPEVDRSRIGVTGRSGGGAYSWWIAALDDRIKVAVPTAGITTLENHVLDGAIEGHCDCMFMVNTERWNFDRVAALVAPRPLLIVNTDKDEIFPLNGVMEIYNRTRALYRKLGAEQNIGIHIAEGPHEDTQPLNFGAFNWINRFLKNGQRKDFIDEPAKKAFAAKELKVFEKIPADEIVTKIDEAFVPMFSAPEKIPAEKWEEQRDAWMRDLKSDCFRAWPAAQGDASAEKISETIANGLRLTEFEFQSEEPFRETLWILQRAGVKPEELELIVLNPLDDGGWKDFCATGAAAFPEKFGDAKPDRDGFESERGMLMNQNWAMAYFCPRGAGPQSWAKFSTNKQTHLRRRLLLLGESLESGQAWDIVQAASALRSAGFARTPLWLQARKTMAVNSIYASLFIPGVKRLDLHQLPASHRDGATYLNVLKHLDIPQAVALAAERATVAIYSDDAAPWRFAQNVAETLQWGAKRVQLRKPLEQVSAESR